MKAWTSALRMLAVRRLTESQLVTKLEKKGFEAADILEAVARAKRGGFVDDRLYAELFVETRAKAVGDRRLVGDLIRRGIDRDAAVNAVAASPLDEEARLAAAYERLMRVRPGTSLPTAARALARKGFATPLIYGFLRRRGAEQFGDAESAMDERFGGDSLA